MAEVQYAANFDIREELNAGAVVGEPNYKGERQIHEALITKSAKRATRDVNAALEKTFPDNLPYATSGDVPLELRSIAEDLSVYYVRRAKHPGPGPLSDNVKNDYYDKPMGLLAKIADKEIYIDGLTSGSGDEDTYDTNADYDPVFDMDPVEDQRVDPDRLEDINETRSD